MTSLLHFDITEKLGEGKNGEAFLALDSGLQRVFVLKLLDPDRAQDEVWLSAFRAQIDTLAKIEDSVLAEVYSVEQDGDKRFVVREFVEGVSIGKLVSKRAHDYRSILVVAISLAEALRNLHDRDIFHGNLTSENVIISSKGGVKLTDCGLAVAGKDIAFVAPEILQGETETEQSDLYSLGAVLYHSLVGVPVFADDDPAKLREMILTESVSFDEAPANLIPSDARLLIGKLLSKTPADRFGSVEELLITLREIKALGLAAAEVSELPHSKYSPRQYLLISILAALLVIFWLVVSSLER